MFPFFSPSDKKCTYGIKCKFYHPERINQSYISLADELREKAQISTVKEERNARQLQSDPAPAQNAFPHPRDSDKEIKKDQQSSSPPRQVSENKLLYWDDPRNSPNHVPSSVTGAQFQKEWPSMHLVPNHYYANMSHDYLDSGLGSFESQYSDIPHFTSNSSRLRPQHQGALPGPKKSPVPLEKNTACSHSVPSTPHQQLHGTMDSQAQPKYNTYRPHVPSLAASHQHALPSNFQYSGGTHLQQTYWSDPFQGLPQANTSNSLPSSLHPLQCHGSCCSGSGHQYHSWGQQPSSAAFDPQRLELRKKLQAIFSPQLVDTVMEMFPHLTNAEKLAVEILNLKAQREFF